jgi:hypothetical protein
MLCKVQPGYADVVPFLQLFDEGRSVVVDGVGKREPKRKRGVYYRSLSTWRWLASLKRGYKKPPPRGCGSMKSRVNVLVSAWLTAVDNNDLTCVIVALLLWGS